MLYTEKELQDTLKKDVTISKETEKRMQETYAQIRRDTKHQKSGEESIPAWQPLRHLP